MCHEDRFSEAASVVRRDPIDHAVRGPELPAVNATECRGCKLAPK
jgi:hypothetical protein